MKSIIGFRKYAYKLNTQGNVFKIKYKNNFKKVSKLV